MKTTWVLSEEERKKKFEGRKINRKRRRRSQEEDGDHDEESDDPAAAAEEPHLISEAETLEVTELVKISGHHDISKVNDMETSLIRDIIRSVVSVVSGTCHHWIFPLAEWSPSNTLCRGMGSRCLETCCQGGFGESQRN